MDTVNPAPENPQEIEPLHLLCTLYTWAMMALVVVELSGRKVPTDSSISAAYYAILTAYAGNRHVAKMRDPSLDQAERSRRGEYYVLAWGLLGAICLILATVSHPFVSGASHVLMPEFQFPENLSATLIVVATIFAGGRVARWRRTGEPIFGPSPRAPRKRVSPAKAVPNIHTDVRSVRPKQTAHADVWDGAQHTAAVPKSLGGAPLSKEAQIGLLGGAVVGDLLIYVESTHEVLQASAKRLYGWLTEELFSKALDRLIAEREIAQLTPGPRGPKTRYKLIN